MCRRPWEYKSAAEELGQASQPGSMGGQPAPAGQLPVAVAAAQPVADTLMQE
eukprot:CAMPEP_0119103140 /NCGR_PEP_ID=MMETSP1180-20130426/1671_1 /TAXON_ID=3052 ORGANISM="Chlamydomonas cf sp, Strain CCMP681" /NCGR_SAMPLE_ID=MMETSP1180 /ASSEMBLY_ACC=CAM_ASM_000741 /LENGTH=51 /DNA_ID=CAMNT_0007087583 /DNA_START=395 /DNA_END=550 /DNA_ORIENTATION=+